MGGYFCNGKGNFGVRPLEACGVTAMGLFSAQSTFECCGCHNKPLLKATQKWGAVMRCNAVLSAIPGNLPAPSTITVYSKLWKCSVLQPRITKRADREVTTTDKKKKGLDPTGKENRQQQTESTVGRTDKSKNFGCFGMSRLWPPVEPLEMPLHFN